MQSAGLRRRPPLPAPRYKHSCRATPLSNPRRRRRQVVEVVGGIYAHSLAIITDAAHLLSDVSGFAVSVFAAVYAAKRSKEHFSYGSAQRVRRSHGRVRER